MWRRWLNDIISRLNIRARLTGAFVGLSVVPLLLIGAYAIYTSSRALEASGVDHVSHDVAVVKEKTENFLTGMRGDILFLRDSVPLRYFMQATEQGDEQEVARWRRLVDEAFFVFSWHKKIYYQIRYMDGTGTTVVQINSDGVRPVIVPQERLHPHREPYFFFQANGLHPGEVVFIPREVQSDGVPGQLIPVLSCVTPVFDSGGDRRGLLITDVFAQDFFKRLIETPMSPGGKTVLVNQDGFYLYHPGKKKEWRQLLATQPDNTLYYDYPASIASTILSGGSGTLTENRDEIIAYVPLLYDPIDPKRFYVIFHSIPRRVLFASIASFRMILGAFLLVSAGVGVVVGFRVTRYFTRPIIQLTRGTEVIASGDFDHRLPVQTSDELGRLTHQFNSMAASLKEQRTALEQAFTELRDAQAQLVRSEQLASLGRLAAGVAHEINNPMASIAACVEGLQRRVTPTNLGELDDLPEYLEIIRKATYRCKRTAEKLLSFSRQAAPIFESVNINDVAQEVISLVDHEAELEGKRVTIHLDQEVSSISGDKAQVGQLLLNLILNGLDAINGTGTVSVTTRSSDDRVHLTVTDTGCGIPEEHLPRIFEPFFTTKPVGKGTGLGLSICESIVRRHGGTIEVTSRVGGGSTFIATFPSAADESDSPVEMSTEGGIARG
ncbi:MAG: HAMP domain-containing protein [Candidatus Latescibacteria bacterium]|nr:HAMP domain-containing protein [Candidatus Latescibacterota bacterium]